MENGFDRSRSNRWIYCSIELADLMATPTTSRPGSNVDQ
jgi:hypothetical protein